MTGLYAVEIEPEVRSWLSGLNDRDFGRVDFLVGLLAEQGAAMTHSHDSYEELARARRTTSGYRQGYAEAQRAFLIGCAVRERRVALGLSQTELARRAAMTQPALSRLEAGGVIPTIPLLERIATALDADLIVEISPHAA